MFFSLGTAFAGPGQPDAEKAPQELTVQIQKLLKDCYVLSKKEDLTATLRLTLNRNKEIVVLSVITENEALERFVKNRLNYKKVQFDQWRKGRLYIVPVRITKA